jgi:hypothetical protein
MKQPSSEFANFDRTMRDLMSVPHSEIKAALDAEKVDKKNKPKRKRRDHRNKNNNPTK